MSQVIVANHSDIIESIVRQNPEVCPASINLTHQPGAKARLILNLQYVPILSRFIPAKDKKEELIEQLLLEQRSATSYKSWYDASAQLDELTGSNLWKLQPDSPDYDYELLHRHLLEMRAARLANDHRLLLYLVRTKWSRNLANMGNSSLYRHSHVGTKRLIEEYIEECQATLHHLVHDKSVDLDDHYLLGMLIQTRKNIGRTALVLSGGATFGVSHIGVLIALLENNLLPRVISGSSAGSVIASILCSHTNEETTELLSTILSREFNFFGAPTTSENGTLKFLLERISHLLKFGTLFDISGLRDTVCGFVGDLTFREAYNRTGKILNITVSPASMHEQTRLLNYLTAPHCLIWSAVCASCSVPGVFASNSIYEKDPRTSQIREWNNDQSLKYVDGSVDGDLPITRLSEMFNVDHIIAVQVNPHVSPVLKVAVGNVGGKMDSEYAQTIRNMMNNCYDFFQNEIIHYLQVLHELNIHRNFTSKMISILAQRYSGDITILPDLNAADFLNLFTNPSPKFLLDFIIKGARAAWPKITIINNHCGVEFALDKEISVLRGRIIANVSKRVTYPILTSTAVTSPDSNSFLVNSAIMTTNEDQNDQWRVESSNGRKPSTGGADLRKIKRGPNSSPSSTDVTKSILKSKFTRSLASLSSNLDANIDRREILRTRHNTVNGANVELSTPILGKPKIIRKARSSGNVNSEMNRLPELPSTFYRTRTPKHEKRQNFQFDYDTFAKKAFGVAYKADSPKTLRFEKEKPNLPRKSKTSSTNDSYIGLNLLRDLTRSTDASTQNSPNNSSQNLRDYYGDNFQTISLHRSRNLAVFKNGSIGGELKTPEKYRFSLNNSENGSPEPVLEPRLTELTDGSSSPLDSP